MKKIVMLGIVLLAAQAGAENAASQTKQSTVPLGIRLLEEYGVENISGLFTQSASSSAATSGKAVKSAPVQTPKTSRGTETEKGTVPVKTDSKHSSVNAHS